MTRAGLPSSTSPTDPHSPSQLTHRPHKMSQETLRNLEALRLRLNTLATSLGKLRHDLETNDPLPSYPSLQNSAILLSHNLATLHATLSNAQPLLSSAHVYPLPSFPGRTQEDLLGQLLRKKLQPGVEDWIEEGGTHAGFLSSTDDTTQAMTSDQWADLWHWAGPEGNRIARDLGEDTFNDVFTLAEQEEGIENVVTGLRRKMWESDDEESGDEGDKAEKMDVDVVEKVPEAVRKMQREGVDESKPVMPLEALLRFASTGVEPPGGGAAVRR